MIRSLVKDPLSYFQSYKIYFVAIYLAFLSFPASDLVFIFSSDLSLLDEIRNSGLCNVWGFDRDPLGLCLNQTVLVSGTLLFEEDSL